MPALFHSVSYFLFLLLPLLLLLYHLFFTSSAKISSSMYPTLLAIIHFHTVPSGESPPGNYDTVGFPFLKSNPKHKQNVAQDGNGMI